MKRIMQHDPAEQPEGLSVALPYHREADDPYAVQDFLARRLYDMTCEIVMSLLIIRDAAKAPELFEKSAQVYVRMAEENVIGKAAYIKAYQADDLDSFKAVENAVEE